MVAVEKGNGLFVRSSNSSTPRGGHPCSCYGKPTWWLASRPTQLEAVGAMVSHTLRLLLPELAPPLLGRQRPPTTSTLLEPPTKSTAQPCLLSACTHAMQGVQLECVASGVPFGKQIGAYLVPPLGAAVPVCVCLPA